MTKTSLSELRESLEYMAARPHEHNVEGPHGARTTLALLEVVEAAQQWIDYEVKSLTPLCTALSRFKP